MSDPNPKPRRRGRPTGPAQNTLKLADRVASALPETGSIASGDLADAVGLDINHHAYKNAVALLRARDRIERPQPGRYARPGKADAPPSLDSRILAALDGQPPAHFKDLIQPTGAPSEHAIKAALSRLRTAGAVESPRPGLYALAGSTPTGDRGTGVPQKMREIFADGAVHRTRDLIADLSGFAAPIAVRHAIKVLAKRGEIVNTATGCWRLNDSAARPRAFLPPARDRLIHAAGGLPDGWTQEELARRLAELGDPMPRHTMRKTLYQLAALNTVVRLSHGRYTLRG